VSSTAVNDPKPEGVDVDWRNPDPGVQKLVEILERAERSVLYWHLVKLFPERFRNASFAYWYAAGWIAALLPILAVSGWWSTSDAWIRLGVILLPLWRLWDIFRWWLDLLVDRRHYRVVSFERNLTFLGVNFYEIVLIAAILFRATGVSGSTTSSWFDAFFLVTQVNYPAAGARFTQETAKALTECVALVLLLGGLAALIGLIADKLREGPWSGPDLTRWTDD
jgi:hypothetical protein